MMGLQDEDEDENIPLAEMATSALTLNNGNS